MANSGEKEWGQPSGYPIPFSPVSASTFALLEAFPNVTVKRGRSVLDESPVLSDEGTLVALRTRFMLPSIKLFSTATKVTVQRSDCQEKNGQEISVTTGIAKWLMCSPYVQPL